MIILEENFKWHLEAFASELFICMCVHVYVCLYCVFLNIINMYLYVITSNLDWN